jgi:hypothetical protein
MRTITGTFTACGQRRRAMIAIENCRTAAPREHVEHCDDYGHQLIAYASLGKP